MWSKSLKNKHQGMTLLEIIIVLGIMGVIAAGVVVLAQRAIDSQNATKLANNLNSTQTAMVSTYRSKKSYPAVGTDPVIAQNLARSMVSMGKLSDEDLINPFTGMEMEIFTTQNNSKANKAFAIKVGGLSKDQCSTLVSNSSDLFEFIQVEDVGGALAADIHVVPDANAVTGVIKAPKSGGDPFDVTNINHITNLCGGNAADAADKFYDVYVGGQ